MNKKLIALILVALHLSSTATGNALSALIIDTDGKQSYYYDTLNQLATTCNFDCSYKNIYDMLEDPAIDAHNQSLFFFVSPQMVAQQQHPIAQEIIQAVHSFARDGNKLIALLLPSHAPADQLAVLLQSFDLPQSLQPTIIAHRYLQQIAHPSAHQAQQYGTSLINKKIPTQLASCKPITPPKGMMLLPNNTSHPSGIAIYNKTYNNIIALIPAIDMTFADIAENFHKNPHLFADRNQLLEHMQELLWQLQHLYTAHELPQQKKPALPPCFTHHPTVTDHPFSAAWLEPKDFYLHEDPQRSADTKACSARKGCQFLHDCGFDLLWFEINPEWYFSERALFKKDTDAVMNIMQKIGSYMHNSTHKKPAIFIGSDITSNFNGQKPSACVYDLFGNAYPNVPSPFAEAELWHNELMEPFTTCYNRLAAHIPIDGLFLDFEMYHAPQQASSYHDLMDFSTHAWQVFKKQHPEVPMFALVQDRVQYLKKNKCFARYFDTLTQASREIGQQIRQQLQTLNPALRVAVYAPTLPSSWFYRGIMGGLSMPATPLITATFNTDFYRHKPWLEQHNIFLRHGSALMMSKLTDTQSSLIKEIAPHHDFVWYNRPSRQLYQTRTAHPRGTWWQAEYSEMPNKTLAKHIKRNHTQRSI